MNILRTSILFLIALIILIECASAQYVTTYAGGSYTGYVDGNVAAAKFNNIGGVACDSNGVLYVADTDNDRIRKIDKVGIVSTYAGSISGFADATGTNAKFYRPTGVAVDNNGWVYVTDQLNHKIRKISPDGVVSTLAGSEKGYKDGASGEARFNSPSGIAVDKNGVVYVADFGNHTIRKITPDGTVSTVAGNGVSGSKNGLGRNAQLSYPMDVVVSSSGIKYVADYGNHRVRKIDANDMVTTYAGTDEGYVEGNSDSAKFSEPTGLSLDNYGNVLVADRGNRRIRFINANETVETLTGSGFGNNDGKNAEARFQYPQKITWCKNKLYITDKGNNTLRYSDWGYVYTLSGGERGMLNSYRKDAKFSYPYSVAVDIAGTLYVLDTYNNCIRKITADGMVTTLAGSKEGFADGQGESAQFSFPRGITVDEAGTVYVADSRNNRIRRIRADGTVTTLSTGYERLSNPTGVAVDADGNVYVTDTYNYRIRKVSIDGTVTTIAGSTQGYSDGEGLFALFSYPKGITVDYSGTLYVTDADYIRKISPDGYVTTIAGGILGYANGKGKVARFNAPEGITVDASGTVYVADFGNNRIRAVYPDGTVTTVAGSGNGYSDGLDSSAQFFSPSGVAMDGSKTVYVADTWNHRIRKITFGPVSVEALPFNNESWTISPNPTTSTLRISIPESMLEHTYTVCDYLGSTVLTGKVAHTENVDISALPTGVYYIRLDAPTTTPLKFVKH
ncbi:MAG: SMP-30/gluconolactonase/LRE family protein [Candidatus Kapabacteria bacterium]|nr:SMP-30/gluconolactonase/LRE family protein [Candidatus Kapabacteria bacterium]